MIWNDSRASGQPNLSQLYYAYSWDGGVTWSANVAVSPIFDSLVGFPDQNKIGDYSGIVSNDTGPTWLTPRRSTTNRTSTTSASFPDCNGNGVSDVTDIANATSLDCDANHVPDECQPRPRLRPVAALRVEHLRGLVLGRQAGRRKRRRGSGGRRRADGSAPEQRHREPHERVGDSLDEHTGVTVTRAAAAFPNLPTHGVRVEQRSVVSPSRSVRASPAGHVIDFTIAATRRPGRVDATFSVRVGAHGIGDQHATTRPTCPSRSPTSRRSRRA